MVTKFMNEVLKDIGYTAKMIDFEMCGYKKLRKHDVEISGMNNNRRKRINFYVYVWENSPRFMIVEQFKDIKTIQELKEILNYIEDKYK